MQSVRLGDQLLAQVKHAATAEGVSVSEFIRRAAAKRAENAPPPTALEAFGDYVGFISSGQSPTGLGDEFGDMLEEKHQQQVQEFLASRERKHAD